MRRKWFTEEQIVSIPKVLTPPQRREAVGAMVAGTKISERRAGRFQEPKSSENPLVRLA